jgi:hypothetical protein
MGILLLNHLLISRHTGRLTGRQAVRDSAELLAAAACDEAFMVLWRETDRPDSKWSKALQSGTPQSLSIPLPVLEKHAAALFPGFSTAIQAEVSRYDFRPTDRLTGAAFFGSEGVGTLEIKARASLRRNGKGPLTIEIIRHHDFKTVAVTSERRRDAYCQNALLDYALFVRQAITEWNEPGDSGGNPFHRPNVKLVLEDQEEVPPDRRGKVFFGGTAGNPGESQQAIFQNIVAGTAAMSATPTTRLPELWSDRPLTVGLADWQRLFPNQESFFSEFQNHLAKVSGIFSFETHPLPVLEIPESFPGDFPPGLWQKFISRLPGGSPEKSVAPGIFQFARSPALAWDRTYLDHILEGHIRQRFLAITRFRLSGTEALPTEAKTRLQTIIGSADFATTTTLLPESELTALQGSLRSPIPLTTRLDSGYPLALSCLPNGEFKGTEDFPAPPPFRRPTDQIVSASDPDFRPFGHFMLRFRQIDFPEGLITSHILNPEAGTIHLRGITRIMEGNVRLSTNDQRPLRFSGTGVLIADDGFTISCGIERSPDARDDDFLVLFSPRGHIAVETSQRIEAVLMAIGNEGTIRPTVPFNIFGALLVDRLGTTGWPAGEYSLRYNPVISPNETRYQTTPSPQITFQRISEHDS